jgi:hypothetical protein
LTIDESASTGFSDPRGLRHAQALQLATWIARNSGNPNDRLGVVRFAAAADGVAPVPAAGATRALRSIFARSTAAIGQGTSLTPAVQLVIKQLSPFRHARRVAVLFSDFQVREGRTGIARDFAALRRVADAVYLVALNGDGRWPLTRRLYTDLGVKGTFVLNSVGRNNLGKTLASIVLRETGQKIVSPQ